MATLLAPKKVCDTLGISQSALRIYCDKYKDFLDDDAKKVPRKFTEADLRTLAFVVASTKGGKTHDQVLATWDEEFSAFEWKPTVLPTDPTGGDSTALVAQNQTMHAFLLDAQRREEQARDRERELLDKVNQLEHKLGKAEGELEAIKATKRKPPAWWVRLFGGGE